MRASAVLKSEVAEAVRLSRATPGLGTLIGVGSLMTLAAGLLGPLVPLYLTGRGYSYQEIGLLGTAAGLAAASAMLFGGRLSDRFGRKPVVVSSLAFSSIILPFYLVLDRLIELAALQLMRGASSSLAGPAMSALMADISPRKGRATVFSVFGATTTAVMSLGLVLSGVLATLSYSYAFFIAAGIMLFSTLLLAVRMREPSRIAASGKSSSPAPDGPKRVSEAHPKREAHIVGASAANPDELNPTARVLDGRTAIFYVVAIRRSGDVGPPSRSSALSMRPAAGAIGPAKPKAVSGERGLYAFNFFFAFALAVYPVFFPLYLASIGVPLATIGAVVAVSWLTFAIAQPVGGRLSDRLGIRKSIILPSLAGVAGLNLVMGLSGNLALVVLAWALIGVGDGLARPVTAAMVADMVAPEKRGRAYGNIGAASAVAAVIAPAAWGSISQLFGLSTAIALVSLPFILAAAAIASIGEPPPETPTVGQAGVAA